MQSYHLDDFFADTYTGTISVRGIDRKIRGASSCVYSKEAVIVYNVQGDVKRYVVSSDGDRDQQTHSRKVTVKDQWNFSPVTTFKGHITEGGTNFCPAR